MKETPTPTRRVTHTVTPGRERHQPDSGPSVSPELMIGRHVENARRQLDEARERLKAARRRVVQLEDALTNWERLSGELRAMNHHPGG